jgi:hypothetical protein
MALSESPHLLSTSVGKMINRSCIKLVKGTPWEDVLFSKSQSLNDQRMLKAFRKKCDELDAEKQKEKDEYAKAELYERKQKTYEFIEAVKRSKQNLDTPDGAA